MDDSVQEAIAYIYEKTIQYSKRIIEFWESFFHKQNFNL